MDASHSANKIWQAETLRFGLNAYAYHAARF